MEKDFDVDFVIPWVDGSDPEWMRDFNRYCPKDRRILDVSAERYRDNGLLKYWFRGVEKFAPWVRKVHFVTCGQKPDWLNLSAPKLSWVVHSDYIRAEFLPVFSGHPIELGMRAIPGLAEQIVYFNDDFFLTAPVRKKFFFRNGLPCDAAVSNALSPTRMSYIVFNDLACINADFNRNELIRRNPRLWLSPRYGIHLLRTLLLLPWPHFTGFFDPHFALPYTRAELDAVWEAYPDKLTETMGSRFRSNNDVNQWLFRYWRLCKGHFYPQHPTRHKGYFSMADNPQKIRKSLISHKYKEIVLNDDDVPDYDERLKIITEGFEAILPEKSSFEL